MSQNMRDFAKRLFAVRRDQVDLKFIFDHLRNYGICAALFYAGEHVLNYGSRTSILPHFDLVSGWILKFMALWLFSLNFTHGLFAIRALSNKPLNQWLFAIVTVFLFFVVGELISVP